MKTYKTCGVVMLPINEKATFNQHQLCIDTEGHYKDKLVTIHQPNLKRVKPQHLYITSEEEPNETDLIIDLRPLQFGKIERVPKTRRDENAITTNKGKVLYKDQFAKIEATSNPSLGRYVEGTNPLRGEFVGVQLPQIPQAFILHYISEYNKGNKVEKVEVEYQNIRRNSSKSNPLNEVKIIECLLVNSDNTINIKPLKESWSKEEHCTDMQYYMEYCQANGYITPMKWLDELKHY